MNDRPLLRVDGISKRFGSTQALSDVSVSFLAGEVHALMGENGAGKSTLGKVIAGLHKQDAGTVTIFAEGRERALRPGSIEEAFNAGVRIVHQELAQCPNLSVAENLCLHDLPRRAAGLVSRREMVRRAERLLIRLDPTIDVRAPLGTLAPGRRQIVQIAAALDENVPGRGEKQAGGHAARVIVFDEPTSSLSISETERLLAIIRQLAAEGLTILYVSHRMGEIFACCDRVTVLRDGRYVATSRIAEIDEPTLVEQMIGRRLPPSTAASAPEAVTQGSSPAGGSAEAATIRVMAGPHAPPPRPSDETPPRPLLEVRGISSPGRLQRISLRVAPGEVLGIGGLVGSGRSELLDAVFGLDRHAKGEVLVDGRPIDRSSPRAAIRAGLGYVPEDRRLQGLFFKLGVDENIVLPVMPRLARAGVRALRAEREVVGERLRSFQVKAAGPAALPGSLSGGNQQKLLIARWMTPHTRVLLLDEPTRGIDVGTKTEIYRLVRDAASRGTAVVLVSSEMPELLALSDRIVVLCQGRATGELRGREMTQANILRLATREEGVVGAAR